MPQIKKKLLSKLQSDLPTGASYASFDRRLIAATIDIFILILISIPLTRLLEILLFDGSSSAEIITSAMENQEEPLETRDFIAALQSSGIFYKLITLQFASIFLMWAYCVFSWSYMKATIGKYIMRLQVTDENGNKISLLRSNARFFGYVPSTIFIFLGFFWIYFNDKHKAWHDYLAKTVVIYTPSKK